MAFGEQTTDAGSHSRSGRANGAPQTSHLRERPPRSPRVHPATGLLVHIPSHTFDFRVIFSIVFVVLRLLVSFLIFLVLLLKLLHELREVPTLLDQFLKCSCHINIV